MNPTNLLLQAQPSQHEKAFSIFVPVLVLSHSMDDMKS